LLGDQIEMLGLGGKYQVLDQEIRGSNGTEFIFSGLGTHTVESIKSFEGCDIVWVEEGQTIRSRSWEILIPTIRKEDPETGDPSEIWISFNPELESDPTFERFILNTPPDATVVKMNWRDNPWFNKVLDNERLYCKETNPKNYMWIWEGQCKAAVEGAIFFDELQEMIRDKRIRNVPYDPMLKVHPVIDLGFGHAMAVALVQVMGPEIRVIKYDEYFQTKLSTMASDMKVLRYNWGKVWLPFADGFSKTSKGQDSAFEIMTAQGERFPRMYWDEANCSQLIECARRYRRSINKVTMVAGAPLNDEYADGGDVIRYIAINANQMTNDTDAKIMPRVEGYSPLDEAVGY
jgi:phage terminase large subunit